VKRFWTEARATGGTVLLDGKPVRTPKRNALALPKTALAEAIAAEWGAVGEELDPRTLPLTGLANAAIDIVAPDPAAFAADLGRYAETDLLAYRAEGPAELVARQAAQWDPLLSWVCARSTCMSSWSPASCTARSRKRRLPACATRLPRARRSNSQLCRRSSPSAAR
jgi:chaperone required for assembly of F1-ATPase